MSFIKNNRKYLITVGLIWAGCLVLFLLAYILVLAPQQKQRKNIESQHDEIKKICDSAINASREETKTKINEEIENLKKKLNSFVVDYEDSSNLTFDISQIANEKKVNSFSIKMQEGSKGSAGAELKYIQENEIDIGFAGNFNQFATFLNALERNEPVFFVNNFRIIRSKTEDSDHRVNMKLAVFVRKQEES
jgi:Tfp pilus assembly protein PilO